MTAGTGDSLLTVRPSKRNESGTANSDTAKDDKGYNQKIINQIIILIGQHIKQFLNSLSDI